MRRKPSVILVREAEEQTTGSSCCGRLDGDLLVQRGERVFAERRAAICAMGPLFTSLRSHFGDRAEIQVVDPRNPLGLVFLLVRDFRTFRVPLRTALKTLVRLPVQAVIVNGRLMARGTWPDSRDVISFVEADARGDRSVARSLRG